MQLNLLPPTNEVLGKVMFLHLSVILFTREIGVSLKRPLWTETPLDRDPLDRDHPGQRPPIW